jgi:uncharacterized membrane protein
MPLMLYLLGQFGEVLQLVYTYWDSLEEVPQLVGSLEKCPN